MLVAGLISAVAAPAAAFGHSRSSWVRHQARGARLEAAPEQVSLEYTEPLNRRLTDVDLIRVEDGRTVAARTGASSLRRLALRPAAPLATGAYRVQWHTVSTEDGHALEGSFSTSMRHRHNGAIRFLVAQGCKCHDANTEKVRASPDLPRSGGRSGREWRSRRPSPRRAVIRCWRGPGPRASRRWSARRRPAGGRRPDRAGRCRPGG